LRAIFGPTNYIGEWRLKYNNEFYTLYKESDIVTYIKINRLKWTRHAIRMEEQSPTKTVLVAVVEGGRQKGRQKLRWEEVRWKIPGSWWREIGGMLQGIGTAGRSF